VTLHPFASDVILFAWTWWSVSPCKIFSNLHAAISYLYEAVAKRRLASGSHDNKSCTASGDNPPNYTVVLGDKKAQLQKRGGVMRWAGS